MASPPSTVASAADALGYDVFVGEDLDPSGRSASGTELALAAMLHRLSDDKVALTGAPSDEVEFGVNVRKWIGEPLTQDVVNAKSPQVEEVLRRDPRVGTIAISLSLAKGADASRFSFFIFIRAILTNGIAIDRVVGVSQVTVEFLAEGK